MHMLLPNQEVLAYYARPGQGSFGARTQSQTFTDVP